MKCPVPRRAGPPVRAGPAVHSSPACSTASDFEDPGPQHGDLAASAWQLTVTVTLHAGDKASPALRPGEAAPAELPEGWCRPTLAPREACALVNLAPQRPVCPGGRQPRLGLVPGRRPGRAGGRLGRPRGSHDQPPGVARRPGLRLRPLGPRREGLARRIFRVQGLPGPAPRTRRPRGYPAEERLLAGPARRRLSAEQLVDSLFAAAGKEFGSERLCVDPEGRRPPNEMLDLGEPTRAWQFASTANERDRPALSLPITQTFVDLMQTYGWRPARQDPLTIREQSITPLQPALLANGIAAGRVVSLSDDSAFTDAALSAKSPESLVRNAFLRLLSREPSDAELGRFTTFLRDSFEGRVVPGAPIRTKIPTVRRVSWSNHLHPRATEIQLAEEKAAREGDPPTYRLTPEFRERFEDVLWALANSPEQVFVP
ncbi:MAG: DUF1553 domain-containing protein [Isosphaeraceae bacterium]